MSARDVTPTVAVVPAPIPLAIEAIERAGGMIAAPEEADAIVWTDPAGATALATALPSWPARWIQLPFAGIESFFEAGVIDPSRIWTCAKGIYGPATAEHALALMLVAARRLHEHTRATEWTGDTDPPMRTLRGTRALVVGTGGIGAALATYLEPLGVEIDAISRSGRPAGWARRTATPGDLPALAAECDWLVVAAALTAETRGLIGSAVFDAIRPGAWLTNVARGGLVDTAALVAALEHGRLGGAALDVTDPEPLPPDHPLWRMPDVIITSHTANTRLMALPALAEMVERNVRAFAAGAPLDGLVDPELGY
ncbi:MAG TPA: NAD(P)-dependent oxidoreductase [Actinomycetota bacterium]|nr:NAD(P)-dependent oxidoreductase [Actinomycetota bacterium]